MVGARKTIPKKAAARKTAARKTAVKKPPAIAKKPAAKKLAAKKPAAKKPIAKTPSRAVPDPLHALPVERALTRELAQVRAVVGKRRTMALFEAEFHGPWLLGKAALRLMKRKRSPEADSLDRRSFAGIVRHTCEGRPVSAARVAEDAVFVFDLAGSLAGVSERSGLECPYLPFAVLGSGAKKSDYFGLLPLAGLNAVRLAEGEAWTMREIGDRAVFSSAHGSGSWSAAEVTALAAATDRLRARCGTIYELGLRAGRGGARAVPVHPVFWFGKSPLGNLVGVFSLRKDG
jgi:hypothetical protein